MNTTLQIDPRVKVPGAVARAAARAEELRQQSAGETPPPEPTPESEPEAEPGPAHFEETTPPEEVTQQVTEPDPTPPAPPQPEPADWEHQYKSLKGRYDKELPRLQTQVSGLMSQIDALRTELEAERKKPTSKAEPKKFVTPDEETAWGSEFLEVVGKKAQEMIAPLQDAYEERIKGLEQQLASVGQTVRTTTRQSLMQQLDAEVPNWTTINEQPEFLEWLQLPDVYSGAIRQNLLSAAFERNDSPRVIAFFKGFLAEEAATSPAEAEPAPGAQIAPRVPLTNLAAPGRAKAGAGSRSPEKPFITRAEVTRFYRDVTDGKYAGRDAARAKREQEIMSAINEGRYR